MIQSQVSIAPLVFPQNVLQYWLGETENVSQYPVNQITSHSSSTIKHSLNRLANEIKNVCVCINTLYTYNRGQNQYGEDKNNMEIKAY